MSEAAVLVARLAEAGTPPELLASVAERLFTIEAELAALEKRREVERENSRRYRARGGGQVPAHVRHEVFERDGYQCVECGAESRLEIDHITPLMAGGTDCHDNLQTLCKPCNARKRDRIRKADKRGQNGNGADGADPCLDKKFPHTPSKIKPNQVPPFIPPIMSAWNEMAGRHKLTKIQSIAGKRRKAVAARVEEHGLDGVLKAIGAVPKSPHWLGANGWSGNFDSLMRPDHCQRMIELADESGPALTPEQIYDNKVKLAALYDRMGQQDEAEKIRRSLAA